MTRPRSPKLRSRSQSRSQFKNHCEISKKKSCKNAMGKVDGKTRIILLIKHFISQKSLLTLYTKYLIILGGKSGLKLLKQAAY